MAEFEPDEESVSRAESLSSRLMHDLRMASEEGPPSNIRRELFSDARYAEQAEGVPINDVVDNVGQMAIEFAAARRRDGEIPCLKFDNGELAPISISELVGGPSWLAYGSEMWFDFWERYFPFLFPPHRLWREFLRTALQQEDRVTVVDVREAEAGVERSLNAFLSYRFAGMKKWSEWIRGIGGQFFGGSKGPSSGRGAGSSTPPPPPAVGPAGGLQVQVSCLRRGLRIHISPAYFVIWVYFGSPTTPVTSFVLPGRYIFAGDGPMLQRRTKDPGVFSIPPTYHPTLTRF